MIIGIRRLGKTGLIQHFFHLSTSLKGIFIDLQGTTSMRGMIEKLAASVSEVFPERSHQNIWKVLKSLRPTITFDPLSGYPEFGFNFRSDQEAQNTLRGLLKLLSEQREEIVIAFDEFQQILSYSEPGVEGTLRSELQSFPGLKFIFSGSQTHLLAGMFQEGSRPFFGSVQKLYLEKINPDLYLQFILDHFRKGSKQIAPETVEDILNWTDVHTYYTQYVCNQLFLESGKTVSSDKLQELKWRILQTSRQDYFLLRDLLAIGQWRLLVAAAKEEQLYQPMSKTITDRYQLGTAGAVRKALGVLMDKQLLNQFYDMKGNKYYKLADVFLMRFIQSSLL